MHGGGVADILDIGLADVRLTHEVDEHLCGFLVLTGGGDGHAVHRQHRSLLRGHPGQVGVVVDHGDGVAGVVDADGRLAADHLIEDLVHDIGLHQRLLGFQLVHHSIHFLSRLGVDAAAALERTDGVGVAAVVEHQDVACILLVPQVCPAGGGLVYHLCIVDDASGAEGVRHSVGILGVIVSVAVLLVDVLEVRDVAVVQRHQHPFAYHLGDHVVRRDDDIVVGRAGLELGVEGLVGVEGGIVDLDAGQLFKGRHHVHAVVGTVGDILAPVVDVQGDVLSLEAGPVVVIRNRNVLRDLDLSRGQSRQRHSQRQHSRQQKNDETLHLTSPPLSARWSRR